MEKKVHKNTGLITALVVFGWLIFFVSFFTASSLIRFILLAIARVLP